MFPFSFTRPILKIVGDLVRKLIPEHMVHETSSRAFHEPDHTFLLDPGTPLSFSFCEVPEGAIADGSLRRNSLFKDLCSNHSNTTEQVSMRHGPMCYNGMNMRAEPQKQNAAFFRTIILAVAMPAIILSAPGPLKEMPPLFVFFAALAFPLGVGTYELAVSHRSSAFSIIGLVNTLLTGGFGLFSLSAKWLIVKETAVPLGLGILVTVLIVRGVPIIKLLLRESIAFDRIEAAFREKGFSPAELDTKLRQAAWWFAGTFFISAAANCALASRTLTADPGSEAFNQGLGSLTAFGFLFIALPLTAVFSVVMFRFFAFVEHRTGLTLDDLI